MIILIVYNLSCSITFIASGWLARMLSSHFFHSMLHVIIRDKLLMMRVQFGECAWWSLVILLVCVTGCRYMPRLGLPSSHSGHPTPPQTPPGQGWGTLASFSVHNYVLGERALGTWHLYIFLRFYSFNEGEIVLFVNFVQRLIFRTGLTGTWLYNSIFPLQYIFPMDSQVL